MASPAAAAAAKEEAEVASSSTTTSSSIPSTSTSSASNLTYLASSSAGSPLYSLPGLDRSGQWKRTLARLIYPSSPRSGGVPIAVDIEFHSFRSFSYCCPGGGEGNESESKAVAEAATTTTTTTTAARSAKTDNDDSNDRDLVYELHYVLDGRGRLSSRPWDGRGKGPRVAAGDSVASFAGSAALRPSGRAGRLRKKPSPPSCSPLPWWNLATLSVTMPRDASAEAAEAAVRAAARKLRGAKLVEGRTLSARDAAAVVSGAKSRSLHGGGGGSGGGGGAAGGGGDFVTSLCCGKKKNKGKKQKLQLSPSPSSPPPSSSPSLKKNESGNGNSSESSSETTNPKRPTATALLRRRPLSRRLSALQAFRLKDQTNRLAVAFDPFSHENVSFTAGIEIFLPGHVTPRHSHARGVHELFFVLSGSGIGVVQEVRRESEEEEEREEEEGEDKGAEETRKFTSLPLSPGDAALFLPMQLHAIDVPPESESPLICLEVMAPDDRFAERVIGEGERTGGLTDEELCALAAVGCGGGS